MSKPFITVSVGGGLPLDCAGLEALLGQLPGLSVIALDSSPSPQVLVWNTGQGYPQELPAIPLATALLILVPSDEPPVLPTAAGTNKVVGLFSKHEEPEALSIAIRQVARGEAYISPALALSLLQRKQSRETLPEVELSTLTERELEVLVLLAQGLSNKAIAARLYLSVRTVDGHVSNLYTRLGVHSRTEAMRLAIEHNLVTRNR